MTLRLCDICFKELAKAKKIYMRVKQVDYTVELCEECYQEELKRIPALAKKIEEAEKINGLGNVGRSGKRDDVCGD